MRRASRALLAIAAVAVSAAVLSGCTADPTPSPPPDTGRPVPTGSAAPEAAIEFHPEGSATDNLPFFDEVNLAVVAANGSAQGREFIDALVAAGFDKTQMQVTSDETTLGDPADSIQFSVLFAGECLIGQYGPKSGGYHGVVRPVLGSGGCLLGSTRPIDW